MSFSKLYGSEIIYDANVNDNVSKVYTHSHSFKLEFLKPKFHYSDREYGH